MEGSPSPVTTTNDFYFGFAPSVSTMAVEIPTVDLFSGNIFCYASSTEQREPSPAFNFK